MLEFVRVWVSTNVRELSGQCLESKLWWKGMADHSAYVGKGKFETVKVPIEVYDETWRIDGLDKPITILKSIRDIEPDGWNRITPIISYKIVSLKTCELINSKFYEGRGKDNVWQ